MSPHWLETVAWISLGLAFACALVILVDELLLGNRQQMWIMNVVHPVTALYLGPVWLAVYWRHGRRMSRKAMHERVDELAREGRDPDEMRAAVESEGIRPRHVANAVSHCGAGCTLGDIGGEWIVFAIGWTIAGATLYPELILDFVLAWSLGILFQYFTIAPMRPDLGRRQALRMAMRADTLSILAFQVGLFGWMVLSAKVIWQPPLPIDSAGHWFMMQVGMVIGFLTSWPVNAWLLRKGWKERMSVDAHVADMLEHRRDRRRRRPTGEAAPGRAS